MRNLISIVVTLSLISLTAFATKPEETKVAAAGAGAPTEKVYAEGLDGVIQMADDMATQVIDAATKAATPYGNECTSSVALHAVKGAGLGPAHTARTKLQGAITALKPESLSQSAMKILMGIHSEFRSKDIKTVGGIVDGFKAFKTNLLEKFQALKKEDAGT